MVNFEDIKETYKDESGRIFQHRLVFYEKEKGKDL